MHLVASVVVVLLVLSAFPFGKMFIVHPSQEVKNSSSSGELEIKKFLLESLELQREPRVITSRIDRLRELWKNTVVITAGNSTFLKDFGNSTCCKHSSQVFMKDLGWDRWVIRPESVDWVQCKTCGSASAGMPVQCCKPTAYDTVLFVYVDEWSSVVMTTVSLTRECGCDPAEDTLDPEIMSPP